MALKKQEMERDRLIADMASQRDRTIRLRAIKVGFKFLNLPSHFFFSIVCVSWSSSLSKENVHNLNNVRHTEN